jgi:hypothetical protein
MTARAPVRGSGTSRQYFYIDGDPNTLFNIDGYPFSMAGMAYLNNVATNEHEILCGFCNATGDAPLNGTHYGLRIVNYDGVDIDFSGVVAHAQNSGTGDSNEDGAVAYVSTGQTSALAEGQWYLCVGVWVSSTEQYVYFRDPINEQVISAGNFGGKTIVWEPFPDANRFMIGGQQRQAPVWDIDGGIKNVALWDIALTEEQARAYLGGQIPGNIASANLQGWWKLDEASGSAIDYSSNGNDLIEYNSNAIGTTVNPRFAVYDSGQLSNPNLTAYSIDVADFINVLSLSDNAGGTFVATATHSDAFGESAESADSTSFTYELVEDSGDIGAPNLESYSSGVLAVGNYVARALHTDNQGGDSLWSAMDDFTLSAASDTYTLNANANLEFSMTIKSAVTDI